MDDWQPIATAPKNNRWRVIVYAPAAIGRGVFEAYHGFNGNGRCWMKAETGLPIHPGPTHWMPLPEPPADE